MSAPPLSKIVRFLLIAAGLIIVLSVLWTFVDSGYSAFLGKIASGLTSEEYKAEQRNGTIYFTQQYLVEHINGRPVKISLPENYPPRVTLVASAIQFGLLLTIALVAATPGLTWRRRILFSLIGAAAAFVLQLLSVAIVAVTFNTVLFVIVSDLFPPVLWAVFSFRYWFKPAPVLPEPPLSQIHHAKKP
jgi:hypothetical protein